MKIAIIGTGNLGLSIAKGLMVNNSITTLYLTKRNPEALADWNKAKQVTVTSDNRVAVKNPTSSFLPYSPVSLKPS